MAITKYKHTVLQGKRDVMAGLWRVPNQSLYRTTNQSNTIHQVNGKENDMLYLHAAEFSLVQDTWERSVNRGYFNTWTGLMEKYINKIPKSDSTIKGHHTQIRKHARSTTTKNNIGDENKNTDKYNNNITES